MMKIVGCKVVFVLGAAVLGASVSGQVLTGRESRLNWNYVYGAGGDTHTGNTDRPRSLLLLADSDSTGFTGSTAGFLPGGTPYSAGVDCSISHQYVVTGTPQEVQSIAASGTSEVSSVTTGAGSAAMFSSNPGNEIRLSFTVDRAIEYRISGSIAIPGASAFSSVALQRFDGITWQYLFWSAFLPTGMGNFDQSGTLVPGQYRVISGLAINTNGTQFFTGGVNYLLEMPGAGGCAADLNGDSVVDDSDFSIFVVAYDLLDCADPAMPSDCPADLNRDGTVDDADFTVFVAAYDALLCA